MANGTARLRWHRWIWLLPLLWPGVAQAQYCGVCGKDPLTIYTVTDEVTHEKRFFCEDCVKKKPRCTFCGLPSADTATTLPDGRVFCPRDAKVVVLDEAEAKEICREAKDALNSLFSRFTTFPETNVTVEIVDRRRMDLLVRTPGFDRQCPSVQGYVRSRVVQGGEWRHPISIMNGVPRGDLIAVCAHEHAHTWVRENVTPTREMNRDSEEGFCELVGYLLAESFNDEAAMKRIKENRYTDGQFNLFLEADKAYDFYTIIQWMKWGTDHELLEEEPDRIRRIAEKPNRPPTATVVTPIRVGPTPVPDQLTLIGILGSGSRRLALINDRSLGAGESGKVRYATTNTTVRCVEIRTNSVVVEIGDEKRREELILKVK